MEYYRNVRKISSSPQKYDNKRFFRTADLIREYKNYQYFEQRLENSLLDRSSIKRNVKGTSSVVNSDNILNNNHENAASANANNVNNNNNLITYEPLSESSWIELVLPFTILAITIFAVIFIAVILFVWIHKYYREKREKSQIDSKQQQSESVVYCTKKRCFKVNNNNNRCKMNSRKWLKGKLKKIDNQVVNDLEQKLETIEFKSTPPTSPNTQKLGESEDQQQQHIQHEQSDDNDDSEEEGCENPESAIIPCPLMISDISITSIIQPPTTSHPADLKPAVSNSSLSLLQEEVSDLYG